MRKQYRHIAGEDQKVLVSLIPTEHSSCLEEINANAKLLEAAIPFPCKKGVIELMLIKRGINRGKWMISMTITHGKEMSRESLTRFLEGAGFKLTSPP